MWPWKLYQGIDKFFSFRRSKPIKDQFYDDIFLREHWHNTDSDEEEDEETQLPTQEVIDDFINKVELLQKVFEVRGAIKCCFCNQALYDYLDFNSHMVEDHFIKKPNGHLKELTEDDKIRHRSIQEEVFFVAPKALAEEAAKRGQSFDLMIYGKGLSMVDPSNIKAKEVTHETAIAEESDEVISAKYLLPLLRSWRREYVCR